MPCLRDTLFSLLRCQRRWLRERARWRYFHAMFMLAAYYFTAATYSAARYLRHDML